MPKYHQGYNHFHVSMLTGILKKRKQNFRWNLPGDSNTLSLLIIKNFSNYSASLTRRACHSSQVTPKPVIINLSLNSFSAFFAASLANSAMPASEGGRSITDRL